MNKFAVRTLSFALTILMLASWTLADTEPWEDKVDPSLLTQLNSGNTVDVLVILDQQADLSRAKQFKTKEAKGSFVFHQLQQTAKSSQKNLLNILQNANAKAQPFYVVNAIHTRGDLALIQLLGEQPEVASIIENGKFQLQQPVEEEAVVTRETEWGIEMINADDVWAMGYTGQGVVVGGQDTGYDWEHPALMSKYRGWDGTNADHNYNWHDAIHSINPQHGTEPNPCGLDIQSPCDDGSHGTHTMGTMIGSDGDNEIGVAPDAKWMACRNMDRGWGTPATYIECFEWLMAPTDLNNENPNPAMAPHVFANSWGCPESEGCNPTNFSVMETVVNNVKSSGVVVVVSAGNSGNDGCSSVVSPAAIYENSFTIGSTRSNDKLSGFSSRGPVTVDGSGRLKPNVSAPGSNVRSSTPGASYANFSGTSMAGPHVVGLVALLISANPALAGDVDMIEDLIESTAVPKMKDDEDCGGISGLNIPNNSFGYGRVDALAAVQAAINLTDTEDVLAIQGLDVYPNPFSDVLYFDFKELFGDVELMLFNATGQNVGNYQWNVFAGESKQLTLPQIPAGVYFYTIRGEQGEFQGKLVKH